MLSEDSCEEDGDADVGAAGGEAVAEEDEGEGEVDVLLLFERWNVRAAAVVLVWLAVDLATCGSPFRG